jgi:hypothetical protein
MPSAIEVFDWQLEVPIAPVIQKKSFFVAVFAMSTICPAGEYSWKRIELRFARRANAVYR